MKILNEKANDVPISVMKDGNIAVITYFPGQPEATGRIVQRYENRLISLGLVAGKSWTTLFAIGVPMLEDYRVRILPLGTQLEL